MVCKHLTVCFLDSQPAAVKLPTQFLTHAFRLLAMSFSKAPRRDFLTTKNWVRHSKEASSSDITLILCFANSCTIQVSSTWLKTKRHRSTGNKFGSTYHYLLGHFCKPHHMLSCLFLVFDSHIIFLYMFSEP